MRTVVLTRGTSTDEGTPGLLTEGKYKCATGELPDRSNARGLSSVPKGYWNAEWLYSDKHKCYLYHLVDVTSRDQVELHAGNFCGDVARGYVSDVLGCLLLGAEWVLFTKGTLYSKARPPLAKDQHGVSASQVTLAAFHNHMQDAQGRQENFLLQIQ